MSRKFKKGYFVRGQFVAEGSELNEELKRQQFSNGLSKSALKAQSEQLQTLGEQLLTLRADLLQPLALPEKLLDALHQLQRITNFEGKRRQSQYVGKLMRQLDDKQIQAIRQAIEEQRLGAAAKTQSLHAAERWRERLIADNAALYQWIEAIPDTDLQQLRALIRQARKDASTAPSNGQVSRQGRAYRELFQLVRKSLQRAATSHTSDTKQAPV